MKVKVAKTAGFCFGVKRAVDKVYQLIEQGVQPIYTTGPDHPQRRSCIRPCRQGCSGNRSRQNLATLSGGTSCDPFPWCGQRSLS